MYGRKKSSKIATQKVSQKFYLISLNLHRYREIWNQNNVQALTKFV